jgi:hypothetical protein
MSNSRENQSYQHPPYIVELDTIEDYFRTINPTQSFKVKMKKETNWEHNGWNNLDDLIQRVGLPKTKLLLEDYSISLAVYLQTPTHSLYSYGAEKLKLLKELTELKKWPLNAMFGPATRCLAKCFKDNSKAESVMKEVLGLKKIVSLLKDEEDINPLSLIKKKQSLVMKTKTRNSTLAGKTDIIANYNLIKSKPRGWNAKIAQQKEEEAKLHTR